MDLATTTRGPLWNDGAVGEGEDGEDVIVVGWRGSEEAEKRGGAETTTRHHVEYGAVRT